MQVSPQVELAALGPCGEASKIIASSMMVELPCTLPDAWHQLTPAEGRHKFCLSQQSSWRCSMPDLLRNTVIFQDPPETLCI